ncbi:HAMP domain-containing sensor histidine kinase [Deinococcus arcticus]|uniref:histidine kinase n=1 Tax=Deinococcus arcticus TaxID=2136176 RepID=A0A2T3WBI2_9DEIO|nr:HAMP domain-containing sensor histidine kinase [Deinococcus arcticus]PTA69270.1 two-component sensor histidine kinase [Deinococcus arcticus]
MRLFPRLFLGHLLVTVLALGALLGLAEWSAPAFYHHHVQQMVALLGPEGRALQPDLERGMRGTLTGALLAALPFAALVAAGTALLTSQRIVRSVRLLSGGSQALAGGDYARRLPEEGRDELAQLAHHFNVLAGELDRVEQDRVALIGNVGHELRAPLAALRGYAEALSDGVLPPEQAAPAMTRELRALERLAADLSLVSRVEAGQVALHLGPCEAGELLRAAAERFADAYEDRGVALRVTPPPGPLPLLADFERALQVLSNLLANALRATPGGGHVTLSARAQAGQVVLSVTDSGHGIPAQHLERIFERFYRVDPARTRGDGSGVGLTIARGLAVQMGGTLRAQSGPGGSTFTLTLPAAEAPRDGG